MNLRVFEEFSTFLYFLIFDLLLEEELWNGIHFVLCNRWFVGHSEIFFRNKDISNEVLEEAVGQLLSYLTYFNKKL